MTIRIFAGAASLLVLAATGGAAQQALGMPFHNGNIQLHSYSYLGGSEGSYAGEVHGAVLGWRLPAPHAATRVALFAGGGIDLSGKEMEVENAHIRTGLSLSRQMGEISPKLSVAAMVGGELFLTEDPNQALKRWGSGRVPVTAGIGYDVSLGAATLTPYFAPTIAWYDEEEWQDETKIGTDSGTDVSAAAGATLQWKYLQVGAGYSRWEHGFDKDGRLRLSLGVSF